jgi:hypothetical protein
MFRISRVGFWAGVCSAVGIFLAASALGAETARDATSKPSNTPATQAAKADYVDEETGEESTGPAASVPPLQGKAGRPTVVRMVKRSSDGGKTTKTVYLEKHTADAKQQLSTMKADDPGRAEVEKKGLLMRSPQAGSKWVPAESPEGQKKIRDASESPAK